MIPPTLRAATNNLPEFDLIGYSNVFIDIQQEYHMFCVIYVIIITFQAQFM